MARSKRALSPAAAERVRQRLGTMSDEEVAAVFGYATVATLQEARSRGRLDLPSVTPTTFRKIDVEKAIAKLVQQRRGRSAA